MLPKKRISLSDLKQERKPKPGRGHHPLPVKVKLMIMGIGVDTVNTERFERIVTGTHPLCSASSPNERTRSVRSQSRTICPPKPSQEYSGTPELSGRAAKSPPPKSSQPYPHHSGHHRPPNQRTRHQLHPPSLADPRRTHMAIAIATAEYLNDAELAHLQKFNPENYRLASSPEMTLTTN